MKVGRIPWLVPCAVLAMASSTLARADDSMAGMGPMDHPMGNLELFLSVRAVESSHQAVKTNKLEDAWGMGDLVFAAERGRFRLMGEYNLSTEEHDFERLQIGIEPKPDTLLWFGRFHHPGSAWNNEFHHGNYLQTAISRPSVELWEDEGGIVPQHLMGLMAESRIPLTGGRGLRVSLGVGYGSAMEEEGFEPLGIIQPESQGRHPSTAAQLAWLPTYLGQSSAGVLYSHHRSGVVETPLSLDLAANTVTEDVLGVYGHWVGSKWRVLGVAYFMRAGLDAVSGASRDEEFAAAYLQVETVLPDAFTLYARHENSPRAGDSVLARSFVDSLILHGNFLGLRRDFPHRQALTLELSRATLVQGPVNRIRLQWSAALP
ncbi:MAG: hypothetical protein RL684_1024 [Pseudomonadota bacterium]